MRKLKLFGVAALVALAASGVAIAQERANGSDTDPAAATFTAERIKATERTCTGADGEYRIAKERFQGTVTSSDARLAGTVVLHTRSVVNQTTGLGRTTGVAHLRGTDGNGKGSAVLAAVNTSPGVLNGLLTGKVRSAGDKPGGALVANFRAVFAANGLSLTGELGGGESQNTAVIQRFAGCTKSESDEDSRGDKAGKAEVVVKKGEVTALSATSLTVKVGNASLTFPLTPKSTAVIEKLDLEVGSAIQVVYLVKGDTVTLLRIRKA